MGTPDPLGTGTIVKNCIVLLKCCKVLLKMYRGLCTLKTSYGGCSFYIPIGSSDKGGGHSLHEKLLKCPPLLSNEYLVKCKPSICIVSKCLEKRWCLLFPPWHTDRSLHYTPINAFIPRDSGVNFLPLYTKRGHSHVGFMGCTMVFY